MTIKRRQLPVRNSMLTLLYILVKLLVHVLEWTVVVMQLTFLFASLLEHISPTILPLTNIRLIIKLKEKTTQGRIDLTYIHIHNKDFFITVRHTNQSRAHIFTHNYEIRCQS